MQLELTDAALSLTQSNEDRVLRVVHVGYGYTLSRSASGATDAHSDGEDQIQIAIDVLGDDLLSDDLLARGVDRHVVNCSQGESIRQERQLTVAQALLDEDIGDDEIKLRINALDNNGNLLTSTLTPVVRGAF